MVVGIKENEVLEISNQRKLLVIFPGIGYTCDKPLLYYSKRMALAKGYEVKDVPYCNFGDGIFGDPARISQTIESACTQTEELLSNIVFEDYSDIIFCSKSIGTCVAAIYAARHGLKVRHIYYTPIDTTFEYVRRPGIMFHGTKDPWCSNEYFERKATAMYNPYYLIENANHSLETGNVDVDLENMRKIMKLVHEYIFPTAK